MKLRLWGVVPFLFDIFTVVMVVEYTILPWLELNRGLGGKKLS